jgi:hypothetical protein
MYGVGAGVEKVKGFLNLTGGQFCSRIYVDMIRKCFHFTILLPALSLSQML